MLTRCAPCCAPQLSSTGAFWALVRGDVTLYLLHLLVITSGTVKVCIFNYFVLRVITSGIVKVCTLYFCFQRSPLQAPSW